MLLQGKLGGRLINRLGPMRSAFICSCIFGVLIFAVSIFGVCIFCSTQDVPAAAGDVCWALWELSRHCAGQKYLTAVCMISSM